MALLLLSLAFTWTASQSKIVWEDVCQVGAFSPTCSTVGESIVIKAALWGRMKLGKCAQEEYGQIGCSNDVSNYLNEMCTGKSTCRIPIPNNRLEKFKTCDSHHLRNYLQVGYECVKEYNLECSKTYTGSQGVIFVRKGRIRSSCSFNLKAEVGQILKITTYDYGGESGYQNSIHLRDIDGSTLISNLDGHKKSYKTLGERVEITLNVDFRKSSRTFISYEVEGCPKLNPPAGAEITFLESDKRADIFCKSNNFIRSILVCEDNNWQGFPVNCSQTLQHADGAALNVFQRTLMICTIVVSLSVAIVLPVIVLVYLRGRLFPTRKPPDDNSVRNNDGNDYYFKVEMNDLDFPLRSVEAPPDLLFGRSNSNYSSYRITDGNYSFTVADDL